MLPKEINIPASADIFDSHHPKALSDEELSSIISSSSLKATLVNPSIIIINDHHRSTPSGRILKLISDLYADIANVDYIVIASGTHEEPTDKQLSKLTFRVEEHFDCEILIHDTYGEEVELVNIGTTSRGTEIKIHPVLLDYENIICINSVEPHYFAGFTGGVKSIIPGLAAKTTVERNHSWALSENSGPTLIEENPLQLDLREGLSLLNKEILGIQLVNFQDDIFHLSIGALYDAFESARKVSLKVYARRSSILYDIVVSIVYPPLDRSLYQAQKGIENTRKILKEGGEMILVAQCLGGVGNTAFFERLSNFSSLDDVLNSINIETYQFGDHKAFKFASMASKGKIRLVGELSENEANRVFANSMRIEDLEDYLNELSSNGLKIAIVLDSGALTMFYSNS